MSTQSIVWATIVVGIALWIAIAIAMSNAKARRLKREARALLPEIQGHFRAGAKYRVHIISGRVLEGVTFVGISQPRDGAPDFLPFPLQNWVVLEKPDGKRIFIKSSAIRMYEEL
jgi:hypothetical protein